MNENITIDTIDIELAKNISKYVTNPTIRNRAMANAIAAKISKKFFENYDVDIKSGLHNVSEVLEQIDISDIYVNGSYIDVRVYFDENECCIPKFNIENDITPLAYMFIRLNPELDSATVTGFISSDAVTTCDSNDEFYIISEDILTSFYNIEPYIGCEDESDYPEDIDEAVYDFLDNKLDRKVEFIKTLLHSKQYRLKLINASHAKQIFNFVTVTPEIKSTVSEDTAKNDIITDETDTLEENVDTDPTLTDSLEDNSLISDIEDNSLEELSDTETFSIDEADSLVDSQIENFEETSEELETLSDEDIDPIEIVEESNLVIDENPENNIDNSTYEAITDIEDEAEAETEVIEEIAYNNDVIEDNDVITDSTKNIVDQDVNDNLIIEDTTIEKPSVSYSTETTPSIDAFETESDYETNSETSITEEDLEDIPIQEQDTENKSIDTLFDNKGEDELDNFNDTEKEKKKSSVLPIIAAVAVVAGLGYFGYTKYVTSTPSTDNLLTESNMPQENQISQNNKTDVAMPLETVENEKKVEANNEGNSLSIPEIERNLGASISVSNLSVQWEVPQSYVSNSTATRYLTRIGKVIQLELKTELLLLSSPPITNKITVEIEYNKAKQKFEIKNIIASSGDAAVDKAIKKTVTEILDTKMSVNMNVFNNMQGNPVLVIRL